MRVAVGVMAKAPVVGEVKTRLTPPLTAEEATSVAVAMLRDVAGHAAATGADVWGVHTGDGERVACHLPPGARLMPQRGRDLGPRLAAAQRDLHEAGYERVLLVGADCPTLDTAYLDRALEVLGHASVVLGPAADGGYTLIGSTHPVPRLFEVTMSTASVLDDTLARAWEVGVDPAVLEPRDDLDTADDLVRAWEGGWLAHAPQTRDLVANVVPARVAGVPDSA